MIKLIEKPLDWLAWLWGLVFPMFSERGAAADQASPAPRWVFRSLVLAAFLLILWGINQLQVIGLQDWVTYGSVGKFWLPLFGFCLYALVWLGWWLYRALSMDVGPEPSEFPDIDRAWAQAMEALNRAEIPLDATPLFLVLGWTSSSEETLFQAAGIKAKVSQVPRDDKGEIKPLHVTADRQAIWLTCPGASLLGQHNPLVTGQDDGAGPLATMAQPSANPYATLAIGQLQGMNLDPSNREGLLEQLRGAPKSIQAEDRERYSARLRHLCRLIKRDRRGFCPVNGMLVLLPVSAADPKSRPRDVAEACQSDLTEAFGVFRMRSPVFVMITDMERVEGFTELVQKIPHEQRRKRLGQRYPLVPDISEGSRQLDRERGRSDRHEPCRLDDLFTVRAGIEPGSRRSRRGAHEQPTDLPVAGSHP